MTRNAQAKRDAMADPVAIAHDLAALPWLTDRLDEWPDPWADGAEIPPAVDGSSRVHPAWIASGAAVHLEQIRNQLWRAVLNPERSRLQIARWAIEKLADLPEEPGSTSGLSLLAAAVDRLPERVAADTRPTAILPSTRLKVTEDAVDRLAFGGLVPADKPQRSLPLFPDIDAEGPRVALLEMADRSGLVTMSRGKGAPIPLRLAVGLLLATPYERRGAVARVVFDVSQLRDFLFPHGWRRTYPGDRPGDWDRTRAGLRTLADCIIPTDPRGGGWFPFRVVHLPGRDAKLTDRLVMDVEGPPGSRSGPVVDRTELARLGLVSGPGFRAYLATQSVQWIPGRTQRRVPGTHGRHGWSADPDDYEVLTAEDRRRLAFGEDHKNRTAGELAAPWGVDGVEVVSRRWTCKRTGRRGWLVVPSAAAERVRQASASREQRNRGIRTTQPGRNSLVRWLEHSILGRPNTNTKYGRLGAGSGGCAGATPPSLPPFLTADYPTGESTATRPTACRWES